MSLCREYLGKNKPLPTTLDEKGKPLPSNLDDMLSERALAFREGLLEMQRAADAKQAAVLAETAPEDSYSIEIDADYLAAVEAGDMDTAQKMVDEAAEKAGYDYVRYTRNRLSPRNNDAGYYMFVEQGKEASVQGGYGDNKYVASGDGALDAGSLLNELRTAWAEYADENDLNADISDEELDPDDIVMSAGVWDDRDFVTYLFDHGFFDELTDADVPAVKTSDGLIVMGDDNSRIKSADPVTYDDNGNVIPLSERFNSEKEDIRYSREVEPKWKPKLSKKEWGLANRIVENYVGADYNDEARYALKTEKGNTVFVIYSTNEVDDDGAILFANRGSQANLAYSITELWREGVNFPDDRTSGILGAGYEGLERAVQRSAANNAQLGNGGGATGVGAVSSGQPGAQAQRGGNRLQGIGDSEYKALKNTLARLDAAEKESKFSREVTNEESDRNWNIPEGYGVFIRNTGAKYVDKIFSGEKDIETRPSRTLDSYLHKWAPIINTETRQVIGEAYIDSVIEYDDAADFRADVSRHLVPEGSKYDWNGNGKRYGYVITDTKKYDTPKTLPDDAAKYGRIAADTKRVSRGRFS